MEYISGHVRNQPNQFFHMFQTECNPSIRRDPDRSGSEWGWRGECWVGKEQMTALPKAGAALEERRTCCQAVGVRRLQRSPDVFSPFPGFGISKHHRENRPPLFAESRSERSIFHRSALFPESPPGSGCQRRYLSSAISQTAKPIPLSKRRSCRACSGSAVTPGQPTALTINRAPNKQRNLQPLEGTA